MSTGTSCHFSYMLQVSKKAQRISLKSDFIQEMFISRGRQPPGDKVLMSADMSCDFIQLLQVKKKISLKSDFIHFFFHDLIQGTTFWCQQKGLITFPICCKFQRNLFEV